MVREFGKAQALDLLITAQWPGGRSEGLEMAAVAGRTLDTDGICIEETTDVTVFLALRTFEDVEAVSCAKAPNGSTFLVKPLRIRRFIFQVGVGPTLPTRINA
jgi:hypothetical protein